MNLDEKITTASHAVGVAERRVKALESLRGAGLVAAPPGADLVLLWVQDGARTRSHVVIRAMRLGEEWVWLDFANHAVRGPWGDLLDLVTTGDRYVVAVSTAQAGGAQALVGGVAVDPRSLD